MKKFFFFFLLLVKLDVFSQELKKDIKQNWYSAAENHNLFIVDSLVLYPNRNCLPKKIDIFEWNYQKRGRFAFVVWLTSNSGIVDPAYQPVVIWKLKKCDNQYCLLMRSKRYKIAFKVFPVYENKILKKVALVRTEIR